MFNPNAENVQPLACIVAWCQEQLSTYTAVVKKKLNAGKRGTQSFAEDTGNLDKKCAELLRITLRGNSVHIYLW